mmetsp:Transcript_71306/g.153878  ORF Transcript_71306/g.153878 Transcript_71306/m.153878 type:complete len:268 (+) Transcript_71306:641-1444(+)
MASPESVSTLMTSILILRFSSSLGSHAPGVRGRYTLHPWKRTEVMSPYIGPTTSAQSFVGRCSMLVSPEKPFMVALMRYLMGFSESPLSLPGKRSMPKSNSAKFGTWSGRNFPGPSSGSYHAARCEVKTAVCAPHPRISGEMHAEGLFCAATFAVRLMLTDDGCFGKGSLFASFSFCSRLRLGGQRRTVLLTAPFSFAGRSHSPVSADSVASQILTSLSTATRRRTGGLSWAGSPSCSRISMATTLSSRATNLSALATGTKALHTML